MIQCSNCLTCRIKCVRTFLFFQEFLSQFIIVKTVSDSWSFLDRKIIILNLWATFFLYIFMITLARRVAALFIRDKSLNEFSVWCRPLYSSSIFSYLYDLLLRSFLCLRQSLDVLFRHFPSLMRDSLSHLSLNTSWCFLATAWLKWVFPLRSRELMNFQKVFWSRDRMILLLAQKRIYIVNFKSCKDAFLKRAAHFFFTMVKAGPLRIFEISWLYLIRKFVSLDISF